MLTYPAEERGSKSLYAFFYEKIRDDIVSGVLKPGEKLPSKRSFAEQNGVSTITIENAYGQLLAEGYVFSRPRSGFYVADILRAESLRPKAAVKAVRPAAAKTGVRFDLAAPAIPADNFPFMTWTRLMRRICSDSKEGLMTPSPANGIPELRSAIAGHLRDFRGIDVSPENIIVGAGTEYLYGLLISLLGRDRLYAMETPGYSKSGLVYGSMDAEVAYVPLDAEGPDIRALRDSHAEVLHISPAHQFPTGIVTSVSRRYELLAWASGSERRCIIEDDYDSELRLSGRPIPALFSIDMSGRVIYMNTFTRSLSPTIRIAYMALPEGLMTEYERKLGFYSCTVSTFEQHTLASFIREGYFEKHINRMRARYKAVRDSITASLVKILPVGTFEIIEQDSGLHFLLKLNTELSEDELRARLGAAGIRASFLSEYHQASEAGTSDVPKNVLLVNYASVAQRDAEALAESLRAALD